MWGHPQTSYHLERGSNLAHSSPHPSTLPNEDRALLRLVEALRQVGYGFVTPTPATHARVNARAQNRQAQDPEGVFGWSRPFHEGLLSEHMLELMRDAGVLTTGSEPWRSLVRVSSLDGELFIHSAHPTVSAESVFFGPDTYRFAAAIRTGLRALRSPVRRAVDIGCGAGPGAILVAKAHPAADVAMVDINETALRYARINACLARTPNAVACRSDLLSGLGGSFDLIVSNPPYLNDPLERAYRHGGGPLGAGLSSAILDAALDRLAPAGTLILYTGVAIVEGRDMFLAHAAERLGAVGVAWTYEEVDPDVFGEELETPAYRDADRIAAVVLTVTKGEA